MNEFVEIRDSVKDGKGVFSLREFAKGEKIYILKQGQLVNRAGIKKLSKLQKKYLDKVGDDKYEIIESPGRFVNHSCEPNSEERQHVSYALRDIRKGEEITIAYQGIAYLEKPFECHCGSKKCRGVISGQQ